MHDKVMATYKRIFQTLFINATSSGSFDEGATFVTTVASTAVRIFPVACS